MRVYWILSSLCILISVGLLMVILGQNHEMDMITRKNKEFGEMSEKAYNKLLYEDSFKDSLQKLVGQGESMVKELETAINNINTDMENEKKAIDNCQAEMKTKKEEVVSKESDHAKTTDALKAEAETWKKEIEYLEAQMKEQPKICNYVAKDKKPKELCGSETKSD